MLEKIFLLCENLFVSYYLLFLSRRDKKLDKKISLIHNSYYKSLRKRISRVGERQIEKKLLFYVVKEIIRRKFNISLNKNQIFNSFSFGLGYTTELATGEGKTLSLLPYCYLESIRKQNFHIITTNDYLAQRDFDLANVILQELDVKLGVITEKTSHASRAYEYKKDIIYTTISEIGFDYLRSLRFKSYSVFPKRTILFIDEIDSLILDTAQTPMIISNKEPIDYDITLIANIMDFLRNNKNLCIRIKSKETSTENISLTKEGLDILFKELHEKELSHSLIPTHIKNLRIHSLINKCIEAKFNIKNGIDYFIVNKKIVLLDKNTGRPLLGHNFSNKLDIILSIKENLDLENHTSNQTHSITIPSILELYPRVIGTTGTISNNFNEIFNLYGIKVIKSFSYNKLRTISTNLTYYLKSSIFNETLIEYVNYFNTKKQPLLINTPNEKNSNYFSKILNSHVHQIINAENVENESKLVNSAGMLSQITISTDITGRGTDIKLGGNRKNYIIKMLGGLSILGTSLNKNKRVLQQLVGRTGRQGNPGIVNFMVNLPKLASENNQNKVIVDLLENKTKFWHCLSFNLSNKWTDKVMKHVQSLDKTLVVNQAVINKYNRIIDHYISYLYFLRLLLQQLKIKKFILFSLYLLVTNIKNIYNYSYFNETKNIYIQDDLSLLFDRRYFNRNIKTLIPIYDLYREYIIQLWLYSVSPVHLHKRIQKLVCYTFYKMMLETVIFLNKNNKYQLPYPSLLNSILNDQYLQYLKNTHLKMKEFWNEFTLKSIRLYSSLITRVHNGTGE